MIEIYQGEPLTLSLFKKNATGQRVNNTDTLVGLLKNQHGNTVIQRMNFSNATSDGITYQKYVIAASVTKGLTPGVYTLELAKMSQSNTDAITSLDGIIRIRPANIRNLGSGNQGTSTTIEDSGAGSGSEN